MPLPQEFHDLAAEVRNWGRWGDDDEIGTLNFITDEVVKAAMGAVRSGRRISLAVPLQLDGLQIGSVPGRINPIKTMIAINHAALGDPDGFCNNDDMVVMGLQAGTHWDGLAHVSYGGQIYGGRPASTVTEWGASVCGVDKVESLTSRGVLHDVARSHMVDTLPAGYAITGDDLDRAAEMGGVEVRSGDIVLVRTGQMRYLHDGDKNAYLAGRGEAFGQPGLSLDTVRWLHHKEVAAVANDTYIFEVFPSENPEAMLAVHLLHIVDMGLTQGQNFDLETLADHCAADGHYDFLLEASPQPFVGGCGSPVNPVAVK